MQTILLSGVGGSTNWLPLIFPLVAILLLLKGGEIISRLMQKRKLVRENKLIDNLTIFEEPIHQGDGNE